MNPVNATALYVSASRLVLQCDPRDPRSLAELCKLLPFFRQSLSCLVCGNLLTDPVSAAGSSCQHYVCLGCKGQRMQLLRPACSGCRDHSRFQENRQLSLLVLCYRKLCVYIARSPLATHIAAQDSPELRHVLDEGLALAEDEPEERDDGLAAEPPTEPSPECSSSSSKEVRGEEEVVGAGVNGLHSECNGLASSDSLLLQTQPVTVEIGVGTGTGTLTAGFRGVLKQESFSEEVPVCVSVTGAAGATQLCDIGSFSEELKHSGGNSSGPLLLSVEEVLRTLDTEPLDPPEHEPAPPQPMGRPVSSVSITQSGLNGPHLHHHHHRITGTNSNSATRLLFSLNPECKPRPFQPRPPQPTPQPPPQPSTATPRTPTPTLPKYHRKRSRSESDSEKVQPLPISSLLRGNAPLAVKTSPKNHPVSGAFTAKPEPKYPAVTPHMHPHQHPHPHLAPVPNGGPPKVGKTVLVSNKALKKTVEHHGGGPKKAYTKARQGAPKPRAAQPRDRVPPHPHPHPHSHPHTHPLTHPPSPSKPLYKKPVEKKGCKCGRATQNPSVLTCRGQRCPCYSNRKACLDCICRGCQNSYMANGEKKLEAFAVPEKALEQTRLTLGINVTSITTATGALRSPATGVGVTTATGVTAATTAFLSAHHDNRGGYDDSALEMMRFDC